METFFCFFFKNQKRIEGETIGRKFKGTEEHHELQEKNHLAC